MHYFTSNEWVYKNIPRLENRSKNLSFFIKDDEVWDKCHQIWDVIKDKLGIKFHSEPGYEY